MTINQWTAIRLANAYGGEATNLAYQSLGGISSEQAAAELKEAVSWLSEVESAEEAERERFETVSRDFLDLVGERARRRYRIAFRLMKGDGISAEKALERARAEIGAYLLAEIYEAGRTRTVSISRQHQLAREHQTLWPVVVALFHKANQYDLAA